MTGFAPKMSIFPDQSPVFNRTFRWNEVDTWGRFLKGGINYTRYNSYSRDKSAILGITIPGIKVPRSTIYPWSSYSKVNGFAPTKG